MAKHPIHTIRKPRVLKLIDHFEDKELLGVELSKDGMIADFHYSYTRDGDSWLVYEKSNDKLKAEIVGLEDSKKLASIALYEFAVRKAKKEGIDLLEYQNGESMQKRPDDMFIYILKNAITKKRL